VAAIVLVDLAVERLAPSRAKLLAGAALLLVCGTLATLTYLRVGLWRSKLLMWTDVVAKSPHKARAHLNLANALRFSRQYQRAIDECQIALSVASHDQQWIRNNIRGEMAAAFHAQSRSTEEIGVLEAGLAEDPNDSGLWGALALAHLQRQDLPQAETAAERYEQLAPQSAAALRVLGLVRMRRGNYVGGTEAFERALQIEPNELQGALLLATAYRTQGRAQEACAVLRTVWEPNQQLHKQLDEALKGCPSP